VKGSNLQSCPKTEAASKSKKTLNCPDHHQRLSITQLTAKQKKGALRVGVVDIQVYRKKIADTMIHICHDSINRSCTDIWSIFFTTDKKKSNLRG
jgi:hypothetical protein